MLLLWVRWGFLTWDLEDRVILDSFTLLGIDIDNKLKQIDSNFDKLHGKTKSLINDWKARNLPIQCRINISKCLLVSPYTYLASIIPLKEEQIEEAQEAINNYVMNIKSHNKIGLAGRKSMHP